MFDTTILEGKEASKGYKQSAYVPLLHSFLTLPVAVQH